MNIKEPVYRILFSQEGKLYQIHAKYISEENLMGFIEIDEIVFSEPASSVVIDPSEEKLKAEFKDVKRSYVPMHLILRIDEVVAEGPAKIIDLKEKASKVSQLPYSYLKKDEIEVE